MAHEGILPRHCALERRPPSHAPPPEVAIAVRCSVCDVFADPCGSISSRIWALPATAGRFEPVRTTYVPLQALMEASLAIYALAPPATYMYVRYVCDKNYLFATVATRAHFVRTPPNC